MLWEVFFRYHPVVGAGFTGRAMASGTPPPLKMLDLREVMVDKTAFRHGRFSNANARALHFHGEGGPISLGNGEKNIKII